jgi:hypothetical protein
VVKPVWEEGNRQRRGENQLDSVGNRPNQLINRPGCDDRSIAEEISGGGVKTGYIRPGIGWARDGGSAAQEFGGGRVKTGRIRPGIDWVNR